ncbi:MAG: bifunctional riboflavin kinase/FAD synthetase [Bacteroidota bacterium]
MNVYHDLNNLPSFRSAVVTIGSFDGVHQGHQKILEKINMLAKNYDGESIVVTFHPHPRLVVYPKDHSLHLITSIEEKIALFRRFGVDNVVVVPFTVEFSQQSADEYIEKFLLGKFQPKCVVIGYDHRFGLNRQGDINFIKWYAEVHQFEVVEIPKQEVEAIAVSSSKIREALLKGNVGKAYRLLGHYFTLTGTVVHGQQVGTKIGFPTANLEINFPHKLIPPDGIYATYVWHQNHRYEGMLYIGIRPTLQDENKRSIEVNIFDFNKQIYGDKIILELVDFIREDATFEGLEALTTQLKLDEQNVRTGFNYLQQSKEKKTSFRSLASVAIVILNYNGRQHLETFLPSIFQTTYANAEIYVADNASTDDSVEYLETNFPSVKIIQLSENHGFAEGYNQALREVESDYYVLLNSDVEVTPNWIEPILELMERDSTVAICQPKILSYHQKSYFEHAGAAGGWMDRLNYPFCRGRLFDKVERDIGQYDSTQEVFWSSGAALFIRGKLFHEIGGFEGDFFAHMEEIDLCWRLKRAGYKVMVRPKSVVYHLGGGSLNYGNPRKVYLNFRNSLLTIIRNEEGSKLFPILLTRLLLDGVAGLLFLSRGQLKNIVAIIKAHWYVFPRFRKTLKKRKKIYDRISKISINSQPNLSGRYDGSIVWQYYLNGKKEFKKLKAK